MFMSVSVITPSIGIRLDYIFEAIESVVAQTESETEIVVVISGELQHKLNDYINFPIIINRGLQ